MGMQMLMGGALTDAVETCDVINPGTGAVFAQVPECSEAQLEEAIAAASAAFPAWAATPVAERARILVACAEKVRAHAQELGELISQEQGRALPIAVGEAMGSARWFEHTAGIELPVQVLRDDEAMRVQVEHRPLGVVAGIAPWNYPVISAVWKIAPALMAGNTIVVKPSPFTPVATLRLGELLKDIIPAGVLNIVTGGDALGRALTAHPAVRKVSLTGSIGAGKSVMRACADDLKRVTLELGGNDAAIVLDDVDPEAIAEKLFWGAFQNTGQVCSVIKRLYVHEDVFEPVKAALLARIARTRLGIGLHDGVEMGPISTLPQYERVKELEADALRAGGTVEGEAALPEAGGYFIAPKIVTGLSDDDRLVAEEQFGPLLPMLPFRDEDEVIDRANGTKFGLSGSVWSGDIDRAAALAARLDCGTAWVNQHLTVLPIAPISGHKWSGIGVENGPWGLASFTDLQTISIAKA